MRAANITVLLVDDHAVVREGYRRLLEQDAGIHVVGEAADAANAYRLFRELQPDVVVMDIGLPGASGLEAMRRMLAARPDGRVLMFSMYEDAIYLKQALRDGAAGYLTKASAPEALLTAVHQIACGQTYVSADIARHLAQAGIGDAMPQGIASLSAREFEILQLLVRGFTLNDIAAQLCVNHKTVANHQSSIKQKLGVENSAQLVLVALRAGLLPLGPAPGADAQNDSDSEPPSA